MAENGWTFEPAEGVIPDPINHASYMHEVYTAADPGYSGRVTVPVLWDKKSNTIVSNESSEIIRMFNSAFDGVGAKSGDYYPEALRTEIDEINTRIYSNVNIMVSTRPVSQPRKRPMRKRSCRCSKHLTGWNKDCQNNVILWVMS
jgi:glutathionyl-hydroquinone reductase